MSVVAMSAPDCSENCLSVGTRLADFDITGVLGEGGFGIVYLAFDHALQRRIAIKEYMPGVLAARGGDHSIAVRAERHQETFNVGLKSFINEARLLARFDHPALVKVYRYWEQNRTAYTAMQYYEGRTIKDIVEHDPQLVTESWCRSVLAQILEALALLDATSIVHRDVSPDNIIIQDNGQAVLLDFGSARQIIGDHARGLTVILKPGYAPVEQYAGDASLEQGAWTDIYALCAVMYYAITGEPPITSIARMVKDPLTPLRERAPAGFSDSFLAALDQGLAVLAEQRPRSIAQFRALLGIAASTTATAGPARLATAEHIDDTAGMTSIDPDQTIPYPAPPAAAPASKAPVPRERRAWLVPAFAAVAAIVLIGVAMQVLLGDADEVMRPVQTAAAPPAQPETMPAEAPPPPLVLHQAAPQPLPAAALPAPAPAPAAADELEQLVQQQAQSEPAAPAVDEAEAPAPEKVSYQLAIRPSGTIYVDGKRVGATPALKSLELAPGKHRIRVSNAGFPDYLVTVNVKPGKPGTIAHHFAASNLF